MTMRGANQSEGASNLVINEHPIIFTGNSSSFLALLCFDPMHGGQFLLRFCIYSEYKSIGNAEPAWHLRCQTSVTVAGGNLVIVGVRVLSGVCSLLAFPNLAMISSFQLIADNNRTDDGGTVWLSGIVSTNWLCLMPSSISDSTRSRLCTPIHSENRCFFVCRQIELNWIETRVLVLARNCLVNSSVSANCEDDT